MILLKKIVDLLFQPLSFSLLILLLSLIYIQFRQTQRRGKYFVFFGIMLLAVAGHEEVSDRLLKTLEDQYPMLSSVQQIRASYPPVKWIVVIGGGSVIDSRLPAMEQLSEASRTRLLEAVRLHRALPGSRLLVSGANGEAQALSRAAQTFDIRARDIVIESQSRDTAEQGKRVGDLIRKDRFVLVTSAFHMPRSVALFKRSGLEPIAAPAHFLARIGSDRMSPERFCPNADGLKKTGIVIHEYLGIAWGHVMGEI